MKKRRVETSISKSRNLEGIVEYWEEHSLADHWDETRETDFEVRATRRRRVTIDPEVYHQIEALAHRRGISPETLVNLLLADQVRRGRRARQQAIEKAIKAKLFKKGWEREKTHSIERLIAIGKDYRVKFPLSDEEIVFLDSIYRGRYPVDEGLLPLR